MIALYTRDDNKYFTITTYTYGQVFRRDFMKMEDVPILKQKVLNMLPITQAEIWKTLGISNRECSRLMSIMINEDLITRTRKDRTFIIERKNGNGKYRKDFSPLLSKDGKFSPCCGCNKECDAATCTSLNEWLLK